MVAASFDPVKEHAKQVEKVLSVAMYYGWVEACSRAIEDSKEDGMVVWFVAGRSSKQLKKAGLEIPESIARKQRKARCVPFSVGICHESFVVGMIEQHAVPGGSFEKQCREARKLWHIPVCVMTSVGMSFVGTPRHFGAEGLCQCDTCLAKFGLKIGVGKSPKGAC